MTDSERQARNRVQEAANKLGRISKKAEKEGVKRGDQAAQYAVDPLVLGLLGGHFAATNPGKAAQILREKSARIARDVASRKQENEEATDEDVQQAIEDRGL